MANQLPRELENISLSNCSLLLEKNSNALKLLMDLRILPLVHLQDATTFTLDLDKGIKLQCQKCHKGVMCREKSRNILGFRFRCNYRVNELNTSSVEANRKSNENKEQEKSKVRQSHKCRNQLSPLQGTWLENCKLDPRKVLKIVLFFISNFPVIEASKHLSLARNTCVSWYSTCRKVCRLWLALEKGSGKKIGGPGFTVEVDEAHLCTRKFHRGRILRSQQYWIFGGICRETKEMFFKRVDKRNKETILPLMLEKIDPRSMLITDSAKVYESCSVHGFFNHKTVNHRKHFVSPEGKGIHTNNIERLWRSLKAKVKSFRECDIDDYIEEFLYRERYLKLHLKTGKFDEAMYIFLTHVALLFPPKLLNL